MSRKSYDSWKIEITQFNKNQAYYVACDCGSLAKKVFNKYYFECPACQKNIYQIMELMLNGKISHDYQK